MEKNSKNATQVIGVDLFKPFMVWLFQSGAKFENMAGQKLFKWVVTIIFALLQGLKYLSKMTTIWEQLKDLDEVEKEEVYQEVCEKFILTNKEAEEKAEEYFNMVLDAWMLIKSAGVLLK